MASATAKGYDQVGQIMAFEAGELDEEATIELFQNLIDTGLAWQLQGSYGRTAAALIEDGRCHRRRPAAPAKEPTGVPWE